MNVEEIIWLNNHIGEIKLAPDSNFKGNYVYNSDSGDIIAVIEGILTFSSPLDAFESVQNGQAAAFLTDIATASYYFEKAGITNLRVGGSPDLGSSHLSIAIRADWKILADIIDKVIVIFTTEENVDIIRNWIGIQSSEEVFLLSFLTLNHFCMDPD